MSTASYIAQEAGEGESDEGPVTPPQTEDEGVGDTEESSSVVSEHQKRSCGPLAFTVLLSVGLVLSLFWAWFEWGISPAEFGRSFWEQEDLFGRLVQTFNYLHGPFIPLQVAVFVVLEVLLFRRAVHHPSRSQKVAAVLMMSLGPFVYWGAFFYIGHWVEAEAWRRQEQRLVLNREEFAVLKLQKDKAEESKLSKAVQQIERFRETAVQKVARDRESVFAIKGREILLADWFQDQHGVTAHERWRVETRLEDTFLQYFRLERENTTVKRLLNESLVVEVRKFLPDEVVSEEVRSVLVKVLGERGESIDWEQTKEFPWGRGTLKLTFVPFEEDFSSTSFPTLAGTTPRQFKRTDILARADWPWGISAYVHGEHEVHCERFIPTKSEELIALYADGLGLTPTGKVELELDFDGVGRWEEFLQRRWVGLLTLEERLVERRVDSDDIHHARLRNVGEWGEETLKEFGRSDQPNDPFARWAYEFSEEAKTQLPSHLSGKMSRIKGKAYRDCNPWTASFNPRMISIQRLAKSRRSIDEWNDTEGYLVRISYFDTEAKTLGPFLELPVQYARYYEEPPPMFVGEIKHY